MQSEPEEDLNIRSVAELLRDTIRKLNKKITNGKIKNAENEKIKISQIRTMIYACKTYTGTVEKLKIDRLEEEIADIKEILKKIGRK